MWYSCIVTGGLPHDTVNLDSRTQSETRATK